MRVLCAGFVTAGCLLLMTSAAAQQQRPPGLEQGFDVVLLQGDVLEGASADLPPAAAAALRDVKGFLPFKSYRLLASPRLYGSSVIESTTRLPGPERDYRLRLKAVLERPLSRVHVTFVLEDSLTVQLRDSPDVVDRRAEAARQQLRAEQESQRTIEAEWKSAADKYGERHPDRLRIQQRLDESKVRVERLNQQIQELERGPFAARPPQPASIIDATFTMQVGETVVVGTSPVQGDKVLIALLTALPQPRRE